MCPNFQLNKRTAILALQWRHNERDGVSNIQSNDYLLNRLFRRRSKKTSKIHVTGLCARNSLVTNEFPALMASNAENISIWWSHQGQRWKRSSRAVSIRPNGIIINGFVQCFSLAICKWCVPWLATRHHIVTLQYALPIMLTADIDLGNCT